MNQNKTTLIEKLKIQLTIKSGFIHNMSAIMLGSIIGQIITFSSSPFLTRIYTPDDFGKFSVYTSIVSILTILATLRYEHAILLQKNNSKSRYMVILNILVNVIMSSIVFFLIIIFNKSLSIIFNIPGRLFYLLPFSMFLFGLLSTFRYLAIRWKKFKFISFITIINSLAVNLFQIILGYFAFSTFGLIFGQTLGIVIAVIFFVIYLKCNTKSSENEKFHLYELSNIAKEYSEFPKYSAPQGLINSLSQALPPILLVYFFGPIVGGIYALSIKFIQLPVSLLSESFRSVFFQKATEIINSKKSILGMVKRITYLFALLSVIPVFIVLLIGPEIYSFILGNQWYDSGVYAKWLSIAVFGSLIATPTVVAISAYKIQNIHMYFEISVLIMKLIGMIITGIYFTPIISIIVYSMISFTMNIILISYTNIYIKKGFISRKVRI